MELLPLQRFRGNVPVLTVHTPGCYFLKRKLTNKTTMVKAAKTAVVPWAFTVSPHRLNSSLSIMTQISIETRLESRITRKGLFD
jgi:hypothetical protein